MKVNTSLFWSVVPVNVRSKKLYGTEVRCRVEYTHSYIPDEVFGTTRFSTLLVERLAHWAGIKTPATKVESWKVFGSSSTWLIQWFIPAEKPSLIKIVQLAEWNPDGFYSERFEVAWKEAYASFVAEQEKVNVDREVQDALDQLLNAQREKALLSAEYKKKVQELQDQVKFAFCFDITNPLLQQELEESEFKGFRPGVKERTLAEYKQYLDGQAEKLFHSRTILY